MRPSAICFARMNGHRQLEFGNNWQSAGVASLRANEEEAYMPVLLLWAVPAVIVVGGVGYYLVRAVH